MPEYKTVRPLKPSAPVILYQSAISAMPTTPPVCSLAGINSTLATSRTINVRGGVDQNKATVFGLP